jgi:hypothetical protein
LFDRSSVSSAKNRANVAAESLLEVRPALLSVMDCTPAQQPAQLTVAPTVQHDDVMLHAADGTIETLTDGDTDGETGLRVTDGVTDAFRELENDLLAVRDNRVCDLDTGSERDRDLVADRESDRDPDTREREFDTDALAVEGSDADTAVMVAVGVTAAVLVRVLVLLAEGCACASVSKIISAVASASEEKVVLRRWRFCAEMPPPPPPAAATDANADAAHHAVRGVSTPPSRPSQPQPKPPMRTSRGSEGTEVLPARENERKPLTCE